MSQLPVYEVLIREGHVDSYGHINNATYLALYEEARWEIITPKGFGFNEIHEKKQGPIILEVKVKFLKEIKLREVIKIESQIVEYKSKVGIMRQQMRNSKNEVANEAEFLFGLFDMNTRKLIEPSVEWRKALGL